MNTPENIAARMRAFRRDALAKPVRFLIKYKDFV